MNQLSYGFKINFSKNLVIYWLEEKEFSYILTRGERKVEEKEKEIEDFLKGKCICVQEENHTYITLYNCEENPLLLFIFVCDKYFIQYKARCILFDRKIKKQFITLHIHVRDTIVNNSSHIKEVWIHLIHPKDRQLLSSFGIEWFFSKHILFMWHNYIFTRIVEEIQWPQKKRKEIM